MKQQTKPIFASAVVSASWAGGPDGKVPPAPIVRGAFEGCEWEVETEDREATAECDAGSFETFE